MPAYKCKENGKWESIFYYVDWTGKRRQKHTRGFNTKREAQEYEAEFIRAAKADMDMSFESFVEIYYSDKQGELKERTLKNKKYMISSHVIPYFGKKKMNEVTPSDIIAWQNEIRDNNDFSPAYLRMLQNQVTAIFSHAQRIYSLSNNPCKRVKKMGKSDGRSLTFWTEEEYQKFIDTFDPKSRHYVMFELLFWTGCREGELLALTMDDIDVEKRQMHINKTFFRSKGKDIITEPKTENSIRTIDLPDFLVEEIQDYYNRLYEYPKNERLFPVVAEAVQHQSGIVSKWVIGHIMEKDIKAYEEAKAKVDAAAKYGKTDKKSLKVMLKTIDSDISQTKGKIQLKDRDAEILTDIQEFAGWVLPKKEKVKKTKQEHQQRKSIHDRLEQGKKLERQQKVNSPGKKQKVHMMEL